MLHNEFAGQNCSAARALEAVGERWTLLIVRDLLHGPQRFADLEQSLAIAKNVLVARLEKLQSLGVIEAVPYDQVRGWKRYQLTRMGTDLFPVISALMAWGDTYFAPEGPPLLYQHTCGHVASPQVLCGSCGEAVRYGTVRSVPGPGAEDVTAPEHSSATGSPR
jgi:DNA-binding HxlR family transcriptional regulator